MPSRDVGKCEKALDKLQKGQCRKWFNAKRTLLERDRLPSRWSCTHTQAWSVLRYCYIETPTKPRECRS